MNYSYFIRRQKRGVLLYTFLLIIYAGSASMLVRSLESWDNIIGLLIPLVISSFIVLKYKVKIEKGMIYFICGFLLFFIGLTIKFDEFHPRFLGIYLINFFMAYVALKRYSLSFFLVYEKILYYLCIISLFFWSVLQVNSSLLLSFFEVISFLEPGSNNVHSNIIVYTISDFRGGGFVHNIQFGSLKLLRNSGFAWEPGAFSVFINLAVFVNLIRTKFKIRRNRSILIFSITLITTFSTTGYIMFIVLLLFYLHNQSFNYKIWVTPAVVIIALYVLSLPFMAEKVIESLDYDTDEQIENSIKYDKSYEPQRIASFIIDWEDFLNNPILGYGGHVQERWIFKTGANISSISGIGKVFAKFGIIGALFFFSMLIKSSIKMANQFNYKGVFFLFVLLVIISVSYSLIEKPLLICFWMFGVFCNENFHTEKYKSSIKERS